MRKIRIGEYSLHNTCILSHVWSGVGWGELFLFKGWEISVDDLIFDLDGRKVMFVSSSQDNCELENSEATSTSPVLAGG